MEPLDTTHPIRRRLTPTTVVVAAGVAALLIGCGSPIRHVRTAPPTSLPTQSAGVAVPVGTSIPVVAVVDIASREGVSEQPTASPREAYFAVLENVTNETGAVVVPQGAQVTATVTRRRNPRIGRPGWLEVSFKSTTGVDGSVIRLDDAPLRFEGKSRVKGSVTLAVLTYGLGLLRKGGDVTLPQGTGLTARVVN